jgi:hypothetical protein
VDGENGHKPEFKIPPVRVPADDCPTQATGGDTVYLHAGEWVEVLPLPDYQMLIALRRMAASTDDVAYDRLCERMARRVTAWSLTDVDGEPLPQPWRNVDAIRELGVGEHMWLLGVLESGGREARKNGSGPSADTSTPTARNRRKR